MAVKYTRRQIRIAVVQYLFSHSFQKEATDTADLSIKDRLTHFWELVNEDADEKIVKATIPPLIHLSEGRVKPSAELQERAMTLVHLLEAHALEAETAGMKPDPDAKKLYQLLKTHLKSDANWQPLLHKLQIYHQQNSPSIEELSHILDELFKLNRSLASQAAAILTQIECVPAAKELGEPVAARLRKLILVCRRIQVLEEPEAHEPQQTTTKILAFRKELNALVAPSNKLIKTVLTHLDAIDQQIATLIENYDPERLDPIIKAILRVGAAEINYCDDVPVPVAINEAIEIAQSFCDHDAAKFVNGILDKLAKPKNSATSL